jgi:hypothetical protein
MFRGYAAGPGFAAWFLVKITISYFGQIVIVGGDGLFYGMPPPAGTTWKSVFLNESD